MTVGANVRGWLRAGRDWGWARLRHPQMGRARTLVLVLAGLIALLVVADLLLASVTVSCNGNAPTAVGVPLRVSKLPVLAAAVMPAGSVPEVSVHTYGALPPTAMTFAE